MLKGTSLWGFEQRFKTLKNMKNIDYAMELARTAGYENFKGIMLCGSVARGKERKDSDIDIMFIKKWKEDYDALGRVFNTAREIPKTFDLTFLDDKMLSDENHIKRELRNLENPFFYVNAIEGGLLFDGEKFSVKATGDKLLRRCVDMMKEVIKKMDPTGYQAHYRPVYEV